MFNEEEKKRIFDQVMNLWAIPEIERRRNKGSIKDDFEIERVQVIFTLGKSPEVKFNEEITIKAMARASRDLIKGEEVKYEDIDKIEKFIVDHPSNSGHITLFRFSKEWIIIFDARYNQEKIKELIRRSKDFYESAKSNLEKNRLIPFYENCWDSAKLSAICHYLALGGKNEKHSVNIKNFTQWSELGNVDKKHAKILLELKDLRKLKYEFSTDFMDNDPKEFLKVAEKMIREAEKLIEDS